MAHTGYMHLLLATTNMGKLRDFASFAGLHTLDLLPGIGDIAAPEEDQPTFAGNAALKAVYYSHFAPGALVLADDSGLEVDALDGAPGVRSARFADDRGYVTRRPLPIDQRNNLCLLDALGSTPEHARSARFRCALSAARDGVVIAMSEGAVEGEILAVPRGTGGFGYDPLFLLPEEGLTMAEASSAMRQELSHRGHALRALLQTKGLLEAEE
jgi:XTP/dITP diphosphohydrolase